MKGFYFLCSLPRAGNTILSSIINQSKKVKITANSITPEIIYRLHLLKNELIYKNFPDEISLNNVINNVLNNYYSSYTAKFIIDRAPWGTPANLFFLKKIIKKPKFVILYRPILECVASFIKIENPKNVESRCEELINVNDYLGKSLWSIKNIISSKENYIIIHYKDFVNNPNKEIDKMFNFLKIPFENFDLSNIKEFSVNNVKYDDSVFSFNLHKIRTDEIKINNYKIRDYLPSKFIEKYSNLDI
jgi:hypothetical protein